MLFFPFALLFFYIYITRPEEQKTLKTFCMMMCIVFSMFELYYLYEGWKISVFYSPDGTNQGTQFTDNGATVYYMGPNDDEVNNYFWYQRVSGNLFKFFVDISWDSLLVLGVVWGYYQIKAVWEKQGYSLT